MSNEGIDPGELIGGLKPLMNSLHNTVCLDTLLLDFSDSTSVQISDKMDSSEGDGDLFVSAVDTHSVVEDKSHSDNSRKLSTS